MMSKSLQLGITLLMITVAAALAPSAAAKTASFAAYFPSAAQYPAGFDILPVRTYSQPGAVFGDMNASLARRARFVAGSEQAAFGHSTVITITIARFASAAGSNQFRTGVHLDVLNNSRKRSQLLTGLGSSGAQYVSGSCATCGPTAPTLGQMYFSRGSMFVLIWIQKANLGIGRQLAGAIDARLKVAHAG